MTTVRVNGVGDEISGEVQVVNATAEQIVLSNSLLVQQILNNLTVSDLKKCASTNFTFSSEVMKLLDRKSIVSLESSTSYQSYFDSLKKGGRIPNMVKMTIGTRREKGAVRSSPKPFRNIPFEIIRRIGADKHFPHKIAETFIPHRQFGRIGALLQKPVRFGLRHRPAVRRHIPTPPLEEAWPPRG
ncbi:uncharacterized protein LOC118437057 isoform X2 [Folsomia candida]|uniref:uncharacterized protein LOC118437057 isoform X2 n=1 Tax=Folsomia candida TaxID=158441 RepID=UPI0016050416|nr:uncharacterized protein LOC118437057 isoform X2 [Folsomia candida]